MSIAIQIIVLSLVVYGMGFLCGYSAAIRTAKDIMREELRRK